jgi:hypothetical protein
MFILIYHHIESQSFLNTINMKVFFTLVASLVLAMLGQAGVVPLHDRSMNSFRFTGRDVPIDSTDGMS